MSRDAKITDTLLYGEGLCREQRRSDSFVWDDEWVVFGDQYGRFGEPNAKHFAVQFRRRPGRIRYMTETPDRMKAIKIALHLEDA